MKEYIITIKYREPDQSRLELDLGKKKIGYVTGRSFNPNWNFIFLCKLSPEEITFLTIKYSVIFGIFPYNREQQNLIPRNVFKTLAK